MRPSTLSILACPSCRAGYDLSVHEGSGDEVCSGLLTCSLCAVVVPIVRGFPLFTEPRLQAGQAAPEALADLDAALFGSGEAYLDYRRRKLERGGLEIYAAFQPFNESSRAVEPLIAAFAAGLKPGGYILDPWCRSGWSSEWLAALFPDQTILALWEGEKSVMGYRGFAHLLGQGRRAPNIEVMFVQPERSLPFADGAFSGVYALDAFHRFSLIPFAGEMLRVAKPSAVIALAHLHFTNSEPSPYFERGGFMWHGQDYRAWLDAVKARTGRRGRVFSEQDLFESGPGAVPREDPSTAHYNGFVLIEPKTARARGAPPFAAPAGDRRLLLSPLFRIHFSRRATRVDGALHDGAAAELLERHPIYQARLPKGPLALSELQFGLLALAVTGRTTGEAASAMGVSGEALAAALAPLEAAELLRPASVSPAGVDLQRFHSNQLPTTAPGQAQGAILAGLSAAETALRMSDGGSLSGAEAEFGLRAFAAYLREAGLGPGQRLSVAETRHPLAFLLVLAGLASGLQVNVGEAAGADLTVGEGRGPGRVAFGLDGGDGDTVLTWMGDHPDAPPLAIIAGGGVGLRLDDRVVALDAEMLVEAALSLGAAAEVRPAPVDGFGDLVGFLSCLTHIGQNRAPIFAA